MITTTSQIWTKHQSIWSILAGVVIDVCNSKQRCMITIDTIGFLISKESGTVTLSVLITERPVAQTEIDHY